MVPRFPPPPNSEEKAWFNTPMIRVPAGRATLGCALPIGREHTCLSVTGSRAAELQLRKSTLPVAVIVDLLAVAIRPVRHYPNHTCSHGLKSNRRSGSSIQMAGKPFFLATSQACLKASSTGSHRLLAT
jgi:hypothetical protein